MGVKLPKNIQHIHLIAICGTGMGSLAGLLKEKGFHITGSDQNIYPPMSTSLAQLGIPLFQGYKSQNLDQRPDLIIVGNAISQTNPEVQEMLRQNIPYLSMPQAISHFFIKDKRSIVVSGTHGKTTTCAIISHLLLELDQDPSFLFGGVLQSNQKNYRTGRGPYFVIEGDEYDTAYFDKGSKFLHYQPYYTVITSLEFDHADIFKDLDHLIQAFKQLIQKINPKGLLLVCSHYDTILQLLPQCKVPTETYGFIDSSDWQAKNITFESHITCFDIFYKKNEICRLQSPLMGEHNILNTLVAFSLLHKFGLNSELIQKALLTFQGVKRRQEIRGIINQITVIDDFAHHPTAVEQTIQAVKKRFPQKKVWAVFEPRSNTSKRNIFQNQYAQALSHADSVIIADVFMPEKVTSGKVLDVDDIAKSISKNGVPALHISGVETMTDYLIQNVKSNSVILIMSNGGFGGLHEKVLLRLQEKGGE